MKTDSQRVGPERPLQNLVKHAVTQRIEYVIQLEEDIQRSKTGLSSLLPHIFNFLSFQLTDLSIFATK